MAGAVRFDCLLGCSSTWGYNRDALIALYRSGDAHMLADKLLGIGYDHIASYYLLGSAAEKLGNNKAALQYYNLGKNSNPCNYGSGCDELGLPEALDGRIIALNKAGVK